MSVIAPPPPSTPKQPSDPEALIEEARRQTRRRRRRNAAAATLLLGLAALGIAAHGRGGSPTSETSTHRPAKLHVGTASSVMHNGPLTVIKQSVGHGGVYTVGRSGLGTMLLRCRGAHSACLELEYIAWSPDGTRIALGVTSYGTPSSYDGLHVVDVATRRDVQLTGSRGRPGLWNDPAWSPDGQWLAYDSDRLGEIALASADGSQHRTLQTGYSAWLRYPTWSPDGTRIAFQTSPLGGCGTSQVSPCAIYVVHLDGTHLRLLVRHGASPAWSPSGAVIAYQARCGIRLVTPTGTDATPNENASCRHIGVAGQPVWSPDARKIAVALAVPGPRRGLYLMNADGSDLHRLSRAAGHDDTGLGRPAWKPRQ